jgi:hypothetical protein
MYRPVGPIYWIYLRSNRGPKRITESETKTITFLQTSSFWTAKDGKATKTQSVSTGIALLFLLTSELDGVGGQRHARAALPSREKRYLLYWRPGGPQGPVWKGGGDWNFVPTRIRSQDRSAHEGCEVFHGVSVQPACLKSSTRCYVTTGAWSLTRYLWIKN